MSLYHRFFSALQARLQMLAEESRPDIEAAADLIFEVAAEGGRVFVFGSGHSGLVAQDASARACTLAFFNPIFVPGLTSTDQPYLRSGLMERVSGIADAVLDTTPTQPGDVLVIISNSGRNHVPIEMALGGRARGLHLIAVTGMETTTDQASRHPGGRNLYELVDIVINTHVPLGDGSVVVDETDGSSVGPLSTILPAIAMHAVTAAVTERMLAAGIEPPLFASSNIDGGDERDALIIAANAGVITWR